ncbi:MAG: tetratricopeptide repeat protein [Deltaproteobacteria bacterium]|jgi:tetratricopeptide (TPR) repeat protein|nr:tetratricopeptide repeat protein [Deltaproteobacteria bacterium]
MTKLQHIFKSSGIFLLTTALLVLSACSGSMTGERQNPRSAESAEADAAYARTAGQAEQNPGWLGEDGETIYLYLVLNDALIHGDTPAATRAIQELLSLAPTAELFREAVSIYDFSRDQNLALATAETGTRLYPRDLTLNMMLSELLAKEGRVDEAINKLKAFSAGYGKNQPGLSAKQKQQDLNELRMLLIRLLMEDQRYSKAQAVIASFPPHERTSTLLFYEAQIYKSTGQQDVALQKLAALVKLHPNFTEGWMALAAEAELAKNYPLAADYYKNALKTNDLPQIYLLMLNAQILAGQYTATVRQVMASDYAPDVKVQASQVFMEHNRLEEAETILLSLENIPYIADDVNYWLALLDHDNEKNYAGALERIEKISPDAQNRDRVLRLKTALLVKAKNLEKAIETGEILVEEFPNVKNNWLLLSELYSNFKNYAEAADIAKKALEEWPDDYQLLYALGANLGFLKKTEESLRIMEQILAKNPNDALVLNFAGYMLADNNMELERARNMLRKAMELEPKSYHIVDSMAWVQYRLHDYKKAWDNIRRCIQMGGNDPVIWEHYGDIASALGKRDDALEAYGKALKLEHEDAQEVLKKIRMLKDN